MKPRSYNIVRDALEFVSGVAGFLCVRDAHDDVTNIGEVIDNKVTNG